MSVLAFVEELELGTLYATNDDADIRNNISMRIAAIDAEIEASKLAQGRLLNLIAQPGMSEIDAVADELRKHQANIAMVEAERIHLALKLQAMIDSARQYYDSRDNVQALLKRLKSGESVDPYRERSQIAARLKSLIEVIHLAPAGEAPLRRRHNDRLMQFAQSMDDPELAEMVHADDQSDKKTASRAYFVVTLKNGRTRTVIPDQTDPLQLYEMTVRSDSRSTYIRDFGGPFGAIEVETEL